MKRAFEFNLDACIGEYTKRPATVATVPPVVAVPKLAFPPLPAPPEPEPEPQPEPEPEAEPEAEPDAAPEAQSAAQKMLHELINGPPLLTPLSALQPYTQPPPAAFATQAPPPREAPPDPHRHRHAGILREFGGVREWMKTRGAHDAARASTV